MKLRILDDSIRFRLRRSEVRALLLCGHVERRTRFSPTRCLTYRIELSDIELSDLGPALAAGIDVHVIRVTLRRRDAAAWASSGEVSIAAAQPAGEGTLHISIEKDFPCAHHADDAPHDKFDPAALALSAL